jgi:hypothetical protein
MAIFCDLITCACATGEVFSGYDMCDLILEKWSLPYDIQIKKEVGVLITMIKRNIKRSG